MMNPFARWWRRLAGGPPAPIPQIDRITYQVDIQRSDRVFLTIETRLRTAAPGLLAFRQVLPLEPPYARLHSSLGLASLLPDDPDGATVEIVLPEPLVAPGTIEHLLTALRTAPLPDTAPGLRLRPPYPATALGLTVNFPLTRPPRDLAIRAATEPTPDPTPLQATPRADQRASYVWLKDAPPPDTTFHLTWTW